MSPPLAPRGQTSRQLGLLLLVSSSAFVDRTLNDFRPFIVIKHHVFKNVQNYFGRHDVEIPYGTARGTLEYSMDSCAMVIWWCRALFQID